jgi:hypothetical protein
MRSERAFFFFGRSRGVGDTLDEAGRGTSVGLVPDRAFSSASEVTRLEQDTLHGRGIVGLSEPGQTKRPRIDGDPRPLFDFLSACRQAVAAGASSRIGHRMFIRSR